MVSYHNDNGILEVRHRHEVIRIQAWGPDSVRVRAAQHRIPADSVGALAEHPPAPRQRHHRRRDARGAGQRAAPVEVTFDAAASYPEPLITFRGEDGERAARGEPGALLDAGGAGLRRPPVGSL